MGSERRETKHSTAPWRVAEPAEQYGMQPSIWSGEKMVAQLEEPEDFESAAEVGEMFANASLIAAAPDLLKALRFAVQAMRTAGVDSIPGGICAQAAEEARAAIAKAEGRS